MEVGQALEVHVLDHEVVARSEEQVVDARTGIVGIVAVGSAVGTAGDAADLVLDARHADTLLVLPAAELVEIRPTAATGSVSLGRRLQVEVVVVDQEVFRLSESGLRHGQGKGVIDDVEDDMTRPVESAVALDGDSHGLLVGRARTRFGIDGDPVHVRSRPPGAVGTDVNRESGSRLRHGGVGKAEIDGREAQPRFRSLTSPGQRKRGQQGQE